MRYFKCFELSNVPFVTRGIYHASAAGYCGAFHITEMYCSRQTSLMVYIQMHMVNMYIISLIAKILDLY